ncbi:hypothetical protein D3C86_2076970 [compost metagenome]
MIVIIWMEAVGMLIVIDCNDTFFNGHALTREGDDPLYDKLISCSQAEIGIFKYNYLSTFWNVLLVL